MSEEQERQLAAFREDLREKLDLLRRAEAAEARVKELEDDLIRSGAQRLQSAERNETLRQEYERLRAAIKATLAEHPYLADGDICTLIHLKRALAQPEAAPSGCDCGPYDAGCVHRWAAPEKKR